MKEKITPYDLLEEMIHSRDRELILQAKEYERRLEQLNNDNARIQEILKLSIPREVFDREMSSLNAKIQINTDYMNSMKGKGTGMNSLWVIGAAAALLICSVVSVIIAVLAYTKK